MTWNTCFVCGVTMGFTWKLVTWQQLIRQAWTCFDKAERIKSLINIKKLKIKTICGRKNTAKHERKKDHNFCDNDMQFSFFVIYLRVWVTNRARHFFLVLPCTGTARSLCQNIRVSLLRNRSLSFLLQLLNKATSVIHSQDCFDPVPYNSQRKIRATLLNFSR